MEKTLATCTQGYAVHTHPHNVVTARALVYTFTFDMSEQVSYEQSLHTKATVTPAKSNTESAESLCNLASTHLFFLVTMKTSLKRKK